MGFTPLEGLVMATRSGSVDPGLVAVADRARRPRGCASVSDALEHDSGLTGLAGTADLRELSRARGRRRRRRDALRSTSTSTACARGIAAMAAALGGLDALAFTGGVGEHDARVRARAAAGLAFLGVAVDDARNATADGETDHLARRRRALRRMSSRPARISRSPAACAASSGAPMLQNRD